jgi:hypothetical protein
MESIDKAILGMVSKSSGCNESERTGDLETLKPRGRTHTEGVKAVWSVAQTDRCDDTLWRGDSDGTMTRTH